VHVRKTPSGIENEQCLSRTNKHRRVFFVPAASAVQKAHSQEEILKDNILSTLYDQM